MSDTLTQEATVAQVRAWATGRPGLVVGARGRLSQTVIEAYNKAHRKIQYVG